MAANYWQNKVCVITGGSAGLGRAIGRALAQRGAKVMLVARHQPPLEAAAEELRRAGGDVRTIVADVTWQEDVDRLAAMVAADFGRLDLLCNAAGRSSRAAILDATPEDFQQLLDVNFLAVVRTTRALAPLLTASRGHLVNIGSLASKTASPFLGAYPASKFALAAYTQQLRLELSAAGLHALLVCPGPIAREDAGQRYAEQSAGLPAAAQHPGGGAMLKAIDPDKLAEQILAACERRRAELIVPGGARLLFALAQLSPKWGDWLLNRATRK